MEASWHSSQPTARDASDRLAVDAVESREALARLYVAHAPQLFRYFWVHTRLESLAEDLVSETFLGAMRTLRAYRIERGSFSAWLYAIARRTLAQHAGELAKLKASVDVSVEARHDDTALHLDERIDLRQALSELQGFDREIVTLRFGAELTHPEIAAITGLQPAHVSVLLYRALHRLRVRLTGEQGGHA